MPIKWKCVRNSGRTNFEVGKIYKEGEGRSLCDGNYTWKAASCESAVEWLRKHLQSEVEFEEVKAMYSVGDRVRIVSEWGPGCHQNLEGAMDHWLCKIMTIDKVLSDRYFMVEDEGCWSWFEPAVSGLAEFQKADLRSGDVVQCRNGLQYMVMLDCGTAGQDVLLNTECLGFNLLSDYSDDMRYDGEDAEDANWDIMKVWRAKNYAKKFVPDNMESVFDRQDVMEVSIEDAIRILTDHFGEQDEIE